MSAQVCWLYFVSSRLALHSKICAWCDVYYAKKTKLYLVKPQNSVVALSFTIVSNGCNAAGCLSHCVCVDSVFAFIALHVKFLDGVKSEAVSSLGRHVLWS